MGIHIEAATVALRVPPRVVPRMRLEVPLILAPDPPSVVLPRQLLHRLMPLLSQFFPQVVVCSPEHPLHLVYLINLISPSDKTFFRAIAR